MLKHYALIWSYISYKLYDIRLYCCLNQTDFEDPVWFCFNEQSSEQKKSNKI